MQPWFAIVVLAPFLRQAGVLTAAGSALLCGAPRAPSLAAIGVGGGGWGCVYAAYAAAFITF